MSTYHFTNRFSLLSIAAASVVAATLATTPAWAGDCCSSGGSSHKGGGSSHKGSGGHQHSPMPAASIATLPSHGGQVYATSFQRFEVVYLPYETRVYLYGADRRPLLPRGAEGRIAMQVRGNDQVYRYPLKPVTATSGTGWEEFLVATVDVGRIRDGDMTVTFYLSNLPTPQQPQVSFTQTFALTRARPSITVVSLTESDRAGIVRQRVCPVTGGQLGSMGTPVKLLAAGQPLYLCCQGCVGKVRENPQRYVGNAAPVRLQPVQAAAERLIVATATTADQAAIAQQRVCVVTGGKLGAMGTPIKITAGGQSLFICCKGCVGKVEKDPSQYLAKAAQLRAGR